MLCYLLTKLQLNVRTYIQYKLTKTTDYTKQSTATSTEQIMKPKQTSRRIDCLQLYYITLKSSI